MNVYIYMLRWETHLKKYIYIVFSEIFTNGQADTHNRHDRLLQWTIKMDNQVRWIEQMEYADRQNILQILDTEY